MKRFIIGSVMLASFVAMPVASFAAETYVIDPQHIWVTFGIKHGPWAVVLGRFDRASGEIVFDRDDVTKSGVRASVDTRSINTNFARRDSDLKGPDFLNAGEFPAMTFVSTKVEKTGDKTGTITGDLTIATVKRPMALKVTFVGEAPMGPTNHVGFSAVGEIDINDYRIRKAVEFGFGPKIEIRIEAEANRK